MGMTTKQILQGVHDWTEGVIVYDISAAHNNTKYADLAAALGTNGVNVPEGLRNGGMSVKFIQGTEQSSDNKYVQYRLMLPTFTAAQFTNTKNWQGIDNILILNSNNLSDNGGIYYQLLTLVNQLLEIKENNNCVQKITAEGTFNGYLNSSGNWESTTSANFKTAYYSVKKGDILKINHGGNSNFAKFGFFTQTPSTSVSPHIYVPNNIETAATDIIIAPGDGYITLSNSSAGAKDCYKIISVPSLINSKILDLIINWANGKEYAVGDVIKYNNQPYICKTAFTEGSTFTSSNFISIGVAEAYRILLLDSIKKSFLFEVVSNYTSINGYLKHDGTWTGSSDFGCGYFQITKGDIIKVHSTSDVYGIGYFTNTPVSGDTPVIMEKGLPVGGYNIVIAPIDGYIVVPLVSEASKVINTRDVLNKIEDNIPLPIVPSEIVPTNNGGYLVGKGTSKGTVASYNSPNFTMKNYLLRGGKEYVLYCDITTAYSRSNNGVYLVGYGLNSTIPSSDGAIDSYYDMYENNKSKVIISPATDTYLILNGGTRGGTLFDGCYLLYEKNPDVFVDIFSEIDKFNNRIPYSGKKCLYIGDSISTSNNYQWKKLIEDAYSLNYVRDISGQLAPANGGITIIPKEDESETALSVKTIWYRCAENRMSIYDFDVISLFGGTNDMVNSSLPIGTDNDFPYVDDASGFDEGTVTDVRPETLTFASAFMGCIKMLQRDFPDKEIVICTVLPCAGNYGNWTDPVTNLPASEAIANLQVRIANKYGLKVIPFYWNVRTSSNSANKTFSLDGVHPNLPCALRMRAAFAEILCL